MPGSCHPAGSGEVPGVILRAKQSRVAATRNDHAGNSGAGRDVEKRTHAPAQAHGGRLSILPAYHPERERAAQGNLDRRLTAVELPCWYAGKQRNKECHFDKAPPKTNDLPKANGQ